MRYPIRLEECTWQEIDTALEGGYTTVVIPCATLERHTTHLPMGTTTAIAEEIAVRVARQLGNAFASPIIRPSISIQNTGFPGTTAFNDITFTHMLADACITLSDRGFRYLIVLPTSMHPFAISTITDMVQTQIYEAELPGVVITYGDLVQRRRWEQDYLVEKLGCTHEEAASVAETAMLMAIQPELVRRQIVQPSTAGSTEISGGSPAATAEIGNALLDYLGAEMAREIHSRMLCRR